MPATVHALLVGIDSYLGDVPRLHGCRNDVLRAEAVLRRRVEASGGTFRATTLLDGDATRDAFVAAFRAAFAAAAPGDAGIFYYAGHGSQQEAPPEHLPFEPDGLDETLVLVDSRTTGGLDFADKELAVLVGEVTARGVHLWVVLDCCHSGSGVRDLRGGRAAVRRAPTNHTRRDAGSYLSGTAEVGLSSVGTIGTVGVTSSGGAPPATLLGGHDYVLLAACRSDQTAKEVRSDDGNRGALSAALEAALTATPGPITYLQLQRAVATAVRGLADDQTPLLECRPPSDADRPLLGGTVPVDRPLLVATHAADGWRLDAGALHGIPAPRVDGRTTTLTLHPLTATVLDETTALCHAIVSEVGGTTSLLRVDAAPGTLDGGQAYRAVVRDLPAADVTVHVDEALPGRDALLEVLVKGAGLAVVDDGRADLVVRAEGPDLCVARPGATRPLVAARPLPPDGGALPQRDLLELRDQLAQVGRWLGLVSRHNPTTRLPADAVTLELLDTNDWPLPVDDDGRVRVEWKPELHDFPRIRIRVANHSDRRLFVAVLTLSEAYGVEPLLDGEGEWLDPGASMFVTGSSGGRDVFLSLPPGELVTTDVLKLLAGTEEFASRPLRQSDLRPPDRSGPTRALGGAERGISTARPEGGPEAGQDWTTREVELTTYRAGSFLPVSSVVATGLEGGTLVAPHPTLRASVRISPSSQATREAMVPLVPGVLVDDPDTEPFSLVTSRALGGEVDVLEVRLPDGADPGVVTRAEPLVLTVPRRLAPDESVLPIMFDGEDYLPIGIGRARGDGTEIRITSVPTRGAITERSLGGSLKILFRKVVARRFGGRYDYPHLAVVRYAADGTPSADHDPVAVRSALAGAERALLLVHGIIGDTESMARAVGADPALRAGTDAVLAFDYENLDTPVEDTAVALAAALRAVGVDPSPGSTGPRLTIVAHSMGGLVARCFVERNGGRHVVDRLVTAGTPHAGSAWPKVEDAVTSLLGLGLGGLLPTAGPLGTIGTVLGFLGKAIEHVDTALDEMTPGSRLLTDLATADDPGVPYVAVRGTQPLPPGADAGRARRIVRKLTGLALDAVFRGEPNDLAVTVTSAGSVGSSWTRHPPLTIDAPCSHVTFLSSPAGLAAVREALRTTP